MTGVDQGHVTMLLRAVAALARRTPGQELRFTEAELNDPGVCAMMMDRETGELVMRWFDPKTNPGGAEAMVKEAARQLAATQKP